MSLLQFISKAHHIFIYMSTSKPVRAVSRPDIECRLDECEGILSSLPVCWTWHLFIANLSLRQFLVFWTFLFWYALLEKYRCMSRYGISTDLYIVPIKYIWSSFCHKKSFSEKAFNLENKRKPLQYATIVFHSLDLNKTVISYHTYNYPWVGLNNNKTIDKVT